MSLRKSTAAPNKHLICVYSSGVGLMTGTRFVFVMWERVSLLYFHTGWYIVTLHVEAVVFVTIHSLVKKNKKRKAEHRG